MLESVRNDMIMTLKSLDMWHDDPRKPSEGIPDNDCSWEDVSAPLPVIAQRLYNDHVRRSSGATRMRCLKRRAETASFIVDFAHDTGVPLPEISETHKMMLDEFKACASSWERQQAKDSQSPKGLQIVSTAWNDGLQFVSQAAHQLSESLSPQSASAVPCVRRY
eukprot:gnl/TRDRNA2_/TRDRNA2_138538_c1_seq4.p1 gnl/TRDRNA2_/TRDRNA2_138538_c1~~gnl/TRDRNA2_/TRDRNA2_138538_c1_seq4.p1  ORF type:complete len:164 (+),score=13.22 gnl/TRDRNA2_/TRDRNA2_138538_c1_seq4:164-655(+)